MDLYCVKCRERTGTNNLTTITTKNNRLAISGACTRCGIIFFYIYKKKSGGDIAAKLAKLPGTPWAKYLGEKTSSRI